MPGTRLPDEAPTLLCARLIRDKGGPVSDLGELLNPEVRSKIEARLRAVGLGLAQEEERWTVYLDGDTPAGEGILTPDRTSVSGCPLQAPGGSD